ncbi:MAG TPA: proteasome ATPase [Propionibacteriaceae bacterium]|nr:proteasome ATPase [Propionibacteriaceae bacterium]HPZ48915.1 proteasome ATPase [Propionibacteriaceae bacterium]HQE31578.1 proteasome ATPase [Propionibacteriaceae bacterium]
MSTDADRARELAERRLADARADVRALAQQNEGLNAALKQARTQLETLRAQLDALTTPPWTAVTVVAVDDDETIVSSGGRLMRVGVEPTVDPAALKVGNRAWLGETTTIVAAGVAQPTGEVALVEEVLDGRVVVTGVGDGRLVLTCSPGLDPRAGARLLVDKGAGLALAVLAPPDDSPLFLEEVPDVTYADIGGLEAQLDQIRDAVELPFLERERFARYRLSAPKGVLLYGPPGCGKTMVAKAIASSLAERVGRPGLFLSVKGPELLDKFVGETERRIREVFQRARVRGSEGAPVVIFFDELDALFRTRGSGVSSDVENTVVPALLTELDGVETLSHVLVIGASNREDMIDPALLRPGRLDVKVRLDRPDQVAAADILARYLTEDLPLAPGVTASALVEAAAGALFDEPEAADLVSGAMLADVAGRAKRVAIKREVAGGASGLKVDDVVTAVREELAEQTALRPQQVDWLRKVQARG